MLPKFLNLADVVDGPTRLQDGGKNHHAETNDRAELSPQAVSLPVVIGRPEPTESRSYRRFDGTRTAALRGPWRRVRDLRVRAQGGALGRWRGLGSRDA